MGQSWSNFVCLSSSSTWQTWLRRIILMFRSPPFATIHRFLLMDFRLCVFAFFSLQKFNCLDKFVVHLFLLCVCVCDVLMIISFIHFSGPTMSATFIVKWCTFLFFFNPSGSQITSKLSFLFFIYFLFLLCLNLPYLVAKGTFNRNLIYLTTLHITNTLATGLPCGRSRSVTCVCVCHPRQISFP